MAMAEQAQVNAQEAAALAAVPAAAVKTVQLQEISPDIISSKASSIDLLMDVSLEVTIELGRTVMSVKEILSLGVGSVIELDRMSGDPVDILVNGKLIAKGEVVVIEDNLGVRITSIVSPSERANGL
jgi:flagellar motor switch protein FliN/FliY